MNINKVTQKFYELKIGESFSLKNKSGEEIGSFLRVPSGWIYKYVFRNNPCCCFIPYTEDVRYWDISLTINPCFSCKSEDVLIEHSEPNQSTGVIKFRVVCNDCGANSGWRNTQVVAIKNWNKK